MTTTINASPSNGIVQTADGSGVMKLQSNGVTTNALAWVNFNGVTTTSIRSSYNVSSVTRNGAGDYSVNFASALSDANYAATVTGSVLSGAGNTSGWLTAELLSGASSLYRTSSLFRLLTTGLNGTSVDGYSVNVIVFGN